SRSSTAPSPPRRTAGRVRAAGKEPCASWSPPWFHHLRGREIGGSGRQLRRRGYRPRATMASGASEPAKRRSCAPPGAVRPRGISRNLALDWRGIRCPKPRGRGPHSMGESRASRRAPGRPVPASAPVASPLTPPLLGYRTSLDGLRAIAVLAVMSWHSVLPGVKGGFLGVDIFFVLSGFLITRLLLEEWELTGGIHLGRFYMRRALRL